MFHNIEQNYKCVGVCKYLTMYFYSWTYVQISTVLIKYHFILLHNVKGNVELFYNEMSTEIEIS